MKHIKKLNENFKDDLSGMNLNQMMNHKHSYKDNVYDHLHNIICDEENISEKSFSEIDSVSNMLEDFYKEHNTELDKLINLYETTNMRKQYCAEKIYNDYKDLLNFKK